MSLNKLSFAFAAAGGLLAADAQAAGPCRGPACQTPGAGGYSGPFHGFFSSRPLPAFQAAPWYLYWPYNAHFMTPAPLQGAYYAPPTHGGYPVNPYFPAGGGHAPHGY